MKKWLVWLAVWALLGTGGAQAEGMLVVSDLHLTQKAEESAPVLAAIRQAAAGHDALLILGDSTNNGKPEEQALFLDFLQSVKAETGKKIYVVPGNHDYSAAFTSREFAARFGRFGWDDAFSQDEASASCAVMTAWGACLLLLDTNEYDTPTHVLAAGGILPATLQWVKDTLSSLPPGTPVIACGHHPLLPENRRQPTANAAALVKALKENGVRLYLCGHDHGFAALEEGGLWQITVGQPQAYPGRAGTVALRENGEITWRLIDLYDPADPYLLSQGRVAESLARRMAQGTLKGTAYEGDESAIQWFVQAFIQHIRGELTEESCARLLSAADCQKWRAIETSTVVKAWILGLLEHCPADMHILHIP